MSMAEIRTILTIDDIKLPIIISFSYFGGSPAVPPSLNYPGDPAEPPEIEFGKAYYDGEGRDVWGERLQRAARTWLASNDGQTAALEAAWEDSNDTYDYPEGD